MIIFISELTVSFILYSDFLGPHILSKQSDNNYKNRMIW